MTARLRICLIASSRFPVREPFMGGLEAHTHALTQALLRRGHTVSLFAAPGSDPALHAIHLDAATFSSSRSARTDVGASPESWMREHHAYLDLMLALARGRHGHFDVVHNNSLHHLPVAMSELLPFPVVTTLHTPPVPWLESATEFAASDSRFVAVSSDVARAWAHVVDSRVVHNGVDTSFWRPGPGGGDAIWTGRIVPEKAPHVALDAARLAGVPIDLAGPVHDQAYFRTEVLPRLGATARYLGHLGRVPLRVAVGRASVAVVTPQWDEPFGLVAVEAMASGTPVAAYDRGALGEIVDESVGALVPAGHVEALGAAILDARHRDRTVVRRRVTERFSLTRMVDGYESVYREMSRLVDVA